MVERDRRHRLPARSIFTVFLVAFGPLALGQVEQASNSPDTGEWQCEGCPFTYGLYGDVTFGLGYASDEFFEFGNFGGFEDGGVFGVLGADLFYRAEDARYLDVYGERLGLDSRTLAIEGGRQGGYSLWFEYDGIPFVRADDARTVYEGAGTASQTLPVGWVFADTTTAMSRLDDTLRHVAIEQERESLRAGFEIQQQSPWRYGVDVKHTRREGSLTRGANFLFRAAELVAPVDYETTRVEASVGYVRDRWQLEVAYNVSTFDNDNESLRWENPFTPINGAVRGELAESPDSQSHQVMLSGAWRQSRWLTVAGQVAIAKLEQDEPFLATTLNPGLAVADLPRSNLDGEVITRVANLRLTSNLTDRLSARADFRYDERDNETPRDSFQQVVTDAFLTDTRINEPYSYERKSAGTEIGYRVFSSLKLAASAEREETDRTFQEVQDTESDTYSLQARATPISRLNVNLRLTHEERDNDLDPDLLGPRVNPDLRRFHFADKKRDSVRLNTDFAIRENLVAGLFAEIADEDYSDTRVGLSDARDESYGLDVSALVSERVSAHGFVAVESLDADLAGADIFDPGVLTGVSWRAEQEDKFHTVGFGVEFRELPGGWIKGAVDFTYASADGEIRVDKDTDAPAFPELRTRRFTLEASVERELGENLDLGVSYLVARIEENDFQRDGVAPDTVPNLLGLGAGTPDETVHVIRAMLRYNF